MAAGQTAALDIAAWSERPQRRRLARAMTLIRQNPLGFLGLILICILVVVGLFAPWLAPHGINELGVDKPLADPSAAAPFGTDNLGRDMLSRVMHGARISLMVGFLSVVGGTIIGMAIGILSGYMGGAIDNAIQRAIDTIIAFPGLILLLIIIRVLGPSITNVIIVVGIGIIPGVARIVRGAVLSEKNNQYVEAARTLGASTPRILVFHIAPNVAALAIVIMTTLLGGAILAESGLSFLGLGIPPPNPSWGADINAARNHFPIHVWWPFFPGLAISLTVLGFNLLGDSLRDVLDPRLRGSR